MSIRAEGRWVVWRMPPGAAREYAWFIRDNVGATDLALQDARDLEAAADEIAPLRASVEGHDQ